MDVGTAQEQQIKQAHRTMWATGDYPAVATEVIAELGEVLVRAAGVTSGEYVLDVASGSGNAAIPAARAGARVVASDLTPELFVQGRRRADEAGVEVTWDEADAEHLPYPDDTFDVAMSCVGIMFAPFHDRAAAEFTRVVRPGGRVAMVNWTPGGFIGRMFTAMKPFAAPPPPGVQPPPLWGTEDHVRDLFGDRVEDLHFEPHMLAVDRFPDPQSWLQFFKKAYGPTIMMFARVQAEGPEQAAALDEALLDLAAGHYRIDQPVMDWEYAVVTATIR
jgi:ubiquinone/menaquinone biosynthesis C-methylase UbiE